MDATTRLMFAIESAPLIERLDAALQQVAALYMEHRLASGGDWHRVGRDAYDAADKLARALRALEEE